jgi:hypothetical protein
MDSHLRNKSKAGGEGSGDGSQPLEPFLKIKGRMIPYEEFTARLKNYCASLGFGHEEVAAAGHPLEICSAPPGSMTRVIAAQLEQGPEHDAVIIFSTRVAYNPNWGGYRGLPRLLVHESAEAAPKATPADFIAPFLHRYRAAQEHIFLSQTELGQYLITLPESLLGEGRNLPGGTLKVHLDRIAKANGSGAPQPLMTSDSLHTYAVSEAFRRSLAGLRDDWKRGRKLPIGTYLGRELFSFVDAEKAVESGSPFALTLLPHLAEIVTHQTPNLLAAEIHLREEFRRGIATLSSTGRGRVGKLLCVAGLDIDMTAFTRHGDHYFVPWQAYNAAGDEGGGAECSLGQDDLFVSLMQQEKQCAV